MQLLHTKVAIMMYYYSNKDTLKVIILIHINFLFFYGHIKIAHVCRNFVFCDELNIIIDNIIDIMILQSQYVNCEQNLMNNVNHDETLSDFEDYCKTNNEEIINQLIIDGSINSIDLNDRDGYLLLIIVKNGLLKTLKLILSKFDNCIEYKSDMLIMSLNYRQFECAEILIRHGVDPKLPKYSTVYEYWQQLKNSIKI